MTNGKEIKRGVAIPMLSVLWVGGMRDVISGKIKEKKERALFVLDCGRYHFLVFFCSVSGSGVDK